MNRRGSPPPKLSPFFPFFLSLLSSKKKSDDLAARDDGGGALASSQPRARSHGDSHSSARCFLAAKTTLFNTTNSRRRKAQFFLSFLSFNGHTLSILFRRASRQKKREIFVSCPFFWTTTNKDNKTKKEVAFRVSFSICGAAFCVFFLPFFSFFCQNSIIFLPHKNPSASPTLFGHARRRRTKGPPSLSLFLSLFWGSLSLSLARKRREERTRARSESNTASRIFSRAGGRCIRARALVGKPSPSFVRANPKERVLLVSRGTRRRGKERKEGFCNRSLSCARAVVAHGLSIYSSIDRSIGKEEQKWTRLCSRRLLESRRSEEKIKTGGRTRRTPKTPPTCPKASRYY